MKANSDSNIIHSLIKRLYNSPEKAGNEKITSQIIIKFLEQQKPDKIIKNIGGYGVAAIYKGKKQGKTIVFRADMDAVFIEDKQSGQGKYAHLCGHDGHMAILAGLAQKFSKNKPSKGKVVLLFQPAEETGEGAKQVLADKNFTENIHPDYVFGLHNLPGFPVNSVIIKNDIITAASVGLKIKLTGKTAHASEPDKGNSPANAIAEIIKLINKLNTRRTYRDFTLVTLVHIKLGDNNFGITPGLGEVSLTLRAFHVNDFEELKSLLLTEIGKICNKEKIEYNFEWVEEFLAVVNDNECVKIVQAAAKELHLKMVELKNPFTWSEDFSWFAKNYKSAFFALGAGENMPSLHSENYKFTDELLKTGTELFFKIYKLIQTGL